MRIYAQETKDVDSKFGCSFCSDISERLSFWSGFIEIQSKSQGDEKWNQQKV